MRLSLAFLAGLVLLAVGVSAQSFSYVANGAFGVRAFTAGYSIGNNMYVAGGGTNAGAYYNDVYRSSDNGTSWNIINSAVPWGKQVAYTVNTLLDNTRVFKIGGMAPDGTLDTSVYSSADGGASWSQISTGLYTGRAYHASAVVQSGVNAGRIVVTGGFATSVALNDVTILEANGLSRVSTTSAPWSARYGHGLVASGSTIVLVGGTNVALAANNEVWTSSDAGASWTQLTSANLTPRFGFAIGITGSSIIVAGGSTDLQGSFFNDVWTTPVATPGTWTRDASSGGFSVRFGSVFTKNNAGNLFLVAGQTYTGGNINNKVDLNDVYAYAGQTVYTTVVGSPGTCFGSVSSNTCASNGQSLTGFQVPSYTCRDSNGNLVSNTLCTAPAAQSCTLPRCYAYVQSSLSQCLTSTTPAGQACYNSGQSQAGSQAINYVCRDMYAVADVATSFCSSLASPTPTTQTCTVATQCSTTYTATITGAGTCFSGANNCAVYGQSNLGLQQPTFTCRDSNGNLVANSFCTTPSQVQCTLPSCYGYNVTSISSCVTATTPTGNTCYASGQSQTGTYTQTFACVDQYALTFVANTNCLNAGSQVPAVQTPSTTVSCTVTNQCAATYQYAWVATGGCLSSTNETCYRNTQSSIGTAQYSLQCRNTNGVQVATTLCAGLTIPTQPTGVTCSLSPCVYQYQQIGFSEYCIGSISTTVGSVLSNFGAYCRPNTTYSSVGTQSPVFVCTQGGVVVPSTFCVNAGIVVPTVAGQSCTLLTCNNAATYVLVGRRQCMNADTYATCYQPGTSSSGVAQAIYQCAFNGQGAVGQCVGAPPTSSTACTLQICSRTSVLGDPEFVGFRGQKYEIHGIPGSIFNIITSSHLQYNAEFVYLGAKSQRACNATRTHPWTHPGTYLGKLGFQVGKDKVQLVAGECTKGIKSVEVNGKKIQMGQTVEFAEKQSMKFVDEFTVQFHLKEVELTLTNSDMFFNQEAKLTRFGERHHNMHGLLGQTWSTRTYKDAKGHKSHVEGHANDYLVQEDDLFGSDFVFNKFNQQ